MLSEDFLCQVCKKNNMIITEEDCLETKKGDQDKRQNQGNKRDTLSLNIEYIYSKTKNLLKNLYFEIFLSTWLALSSLQYKLPPFYSVLFEK